jgi:hypothetical protein
MNSLSAIEHLHKERALFGKTSTQGRLVSAFESQGKCGKCNRS